MELERVMSLPELTVWLLGCYGLTFLVCSAHVTGPIRRWITRRSDLLRQMFECYFCTGFWIALGTAVWTLQTPFWGALHGFAGATFCYVLDAAVRRLEAVEVVDELDQRIEPD